MRLKETLAGSPQLESRHNLLLLNSRRRWVGKQLGARQARTALCLSVLLPLLAARVGCLLLWSRRSKVFATLVHNVGTRELRRPRRPGACRRGALHSAGRSACMAAQQEAAFVND